MTSDQDPTFKAGDRVILISSGECGMVIHTWAAEELGDPEDCYVAFFGAEFPAENVRPVRLPYVLRYAATSLKRVP
jgi:hypothetical protein